jgi:glycosyltransferase involved in cell wall biosynthesis
MAEPDPHVSICIPTFNSSRFLSATLKSVLTQSYSNLEVIVSDGGSTDSTLEVISSFSDPRIMVSTSSTQLLPWENWTRAIEFASGDYKMLLCHDDILLPHAVATLLELHKSFPNAVATAGSRLLMNDAGVEIGFRRHQVERVKTWTYGNLVEEVHKTGTNPIGEGLCVLWKSSDQVDGFSNQWNYYIDLDFWIRLSQSGPIIQSNRAVGVFRVSASSWTSKIGLNVVHEIWKYFRFLYQDHDVRMTLHVRGLTLAIAKGLARPGLQRLVNSTPESH